MLKRKENIQADLKLLASARSKGKEIDGHIVEELTKDSFQGVDYVLGATGNDITKNVDAMGQRSRMYRC